MPVALGRRGNGSHRISGTIPRPWAEQTPLPKEFAMSDKPEWKKALRESNALGWIAFLLLVIAIGVGTIMFGGAPVSVKDSAQATNTSAPKYLK
jgi:hypothetical protein